MIFEIHCTTFFQQTSSFPKVMRKRSGIGFSYTYRLPLVLAIEICFEKKIDLPKYKQLQKVQGTSSKNSGQIKVIVTSYQFTEYVQRQVLY